MNSVAAKRAIRDLLIESKAALVADLAQDAKREIAHITLSVLTPAQAYYFVAVHCERSDEFSTGGSAVTRRAPRVAEYNIVVHIEDYAVSSQNEDELYEAAHSDFDLFVDRIASLIESKTGFADDISGTVFKLRRNPGGSDRAISRENGMQGWFDSAEVFHAMLTSQIRFILVDECVDDSALYSEDDEDQEEE